MALLTVTVGLMLAMGSSDSESQPGDGLREIEPQRMGEIGSFDFVSDAEANVGQLCREPERAWGISVRHASGPVEFEESELNKPNMSEQVSCEGGPVIATWSPTGKRSYYSGTVKVEVIAEGKQVEVTEIDGHEALLIYSIESPGPWSPLFVYVIQREATEDEPGIFVALIGGMSGKSVDETAREALSERCDSSC